MRLHRMRLVNFRQYADSEIVVGPGITGIIGPNGSGKSTLLEAIAWAIYGNLAARGDKEGIRNLRAKPRSSVRVELEFGLGAHEHRVVRGLHGAELYQDGVVVANALTEVTAKLERVLGMRHDEFFSTYFTGQKELAVMASLGKTERAAFLSRVLGYDRLRLAQERVRERRNALASELRGLEAGLPESARLAAERMAAAARLDEVRRAAQAAGAQRGAAGRQVARGGARGEGRGGGGERGGGRGAARRSAARRAGGGRAARGGGAAVRARGARVEGMGGAGEAGALPGRRPADGRAGRHGGAAGVPAARPRARRRAQRAGAVQTPRAGARARGAAQARAGRAGAAAAGGGGAARRRGAAPGAAPLDGRPGPSHRHAPGRHRNARRRGARGAGVGAGAPGGAEHPGGENGREYCRGRGERAG